MNLEPFSRTVWRDAACYTLAALLALAIAMALGFDNPYWAGVAVYVTAGQPSRGLLVQRVLYRLVGTTVGSLVGLAIVYTAHEPLTVALALGIWVTLMSAVGNLFRQFRAYAFFLSGYTAAIVVLPSFFDTAHMHHFAEARVVCNFIGVLSAFAVMVALRPKSDQNAALKQARSAASAVYTFAAAALRGDPESSARRLVIDLAALEEGADMAATPDLEGLRTVRRLRRLAVDLLALVAAVHGWRREEPDVASAAPLAALIDAAARAPQTMDASAFRACGVPAELADVKAAAASSFAGLAALAEPGAAPDAVPGLFYHRDWHAARIAGLRTAIALAIMSAVWIVSGSSYGALAMVGTSVFVTVFSNLETARESVETVAKGASAGIVAALVAMFTLLPLAHSEATLLLAVLPFLALGALGLAWPPTARPAIDANAIFLMTLQLSWPLVATPHEILVVGGSLLGGMALPWLAFRVLPLKRAQRIEALTRQIVGELAHMQEQRGVLTRQRQRWRLYHSVMRLALRLSAKPNDTRLDGALSALAAADLLAATRDTPRLSRERLAADAMASLNAAG